MTYTIKLDWSGRRVTAVRAVLDSSPGSRSFALGYEFRWWSTLAPDEEATIKLGLSPEELDALELALIESLVQVSAALRDVRQYRVSTKDLT